MLLILEILKLLEEYKYPLKSGLDYTNEFTFLIAIILSAQAKDDFINTQTIQLFKLYDTPEKLLELNDGIFKYIKHIGLWRNKGRNILKLCQQIVDLKNKNVQSWYKSFFDKNLLNGDLIIYSNDILSREYIPSFRAGLLTFAGVGRKSANVFLNVIYNARVIPVDTHVIRLSNRLGLISSKDPLEIELHLDMIIPDYYKNKIAHYLVWHGRNVCKAIKPKCYHCLLNKICPFFKKLL